MRWQETYKSIRNTLPSISGKEFLIFLFFLAVSTAFWFLSSLNESYDQEFIVKLHVTDVPENIIITEDFPDSVRVTIHDKGFVLLNYATSGIPPISVKFSLYAGKDGRGSITQSEVQKLIKTRLETTTTIVSVKADRWDFYFNQGQSKRVPVVMGGTVETKTNYYITHTVFTPDSVTVYATRDALDTINVIYTEPISLTNISSTSTHTVALMGLHGAKIEPMKASVSIFVDQLTEVAVNVPIHNINVPDGISLKTFPSRIDIKVAVGMQRSGNIRAEQFTVVADYNNLPTEPNSKLPLKITSQPKGVLKATLLTEEVDYLLENLK